jgi:hypothetical protein
MLFVHVQCALCIALCTQRLWQVRRAVCACALLMHGCALHRVRSLLLLITSASFLATCQQECFSILRATFLCVNDALIFALACLGLALPLPNSMCLTLRRHALVWCQLCLD